MLKLPIFVEIKFKDQTENSISDTLMKYKIGELPFYTVIDDKITFDITQFISNLENVFIKNNFNTMLPYPFYLINKTNHIIDSFIPSTNKMINLPSHFRKEKKKLSPKEKMLLKKINILKQQVHYLNINNSVQLDINQLKKISSLKKKILFINQVTNI